MRYIKDFLFERFTFLEFLLVISANIMMTRIFEQNTPFYLADMFWPHMQVFAYLTLFVWCIFSFWKKTVPRIVLYPIIFAIGIDYTFFQQFWHHIFEYIGLYDISGAKKSNFVNPNFSWIYVLTFVCLFMVGATAKNWIKEGFRKTYHLFFPTLVSCLLFGFIVLFHAIIINVGAIGVQEKICLAKIDSLHPRATEKEIYDRFDCKNQFCAVASSPQNVKILSGDPGELQYIQHLTEPTIFYKNPIHKINGSYRLNMCTFYSSSMQKAVLTIESFDFNISFRETEHTFYRLLGIASTIWVFGLYFHYQLLLNRFKKKPEVK